MPTFVLPRSAFLRPVLEERDELLNALTEMHVLVPGAETLEVQQLRDYVQWQQESRGEDIRKALLRPANQPKKLSRQQVIIGLREYFYGHVVPKREGRKPFYLGVDVAAQEAR